MKFKVNSLRIEKTMTYNDRDGEYEDNKIYILNCTSDVNKKYEVRLWTINGDCYSGWCGVFFGERLAYKIKNPNEKFNEDVRNGNMCPVYEKVIYKHQ